VKMRRHIEVGDWQLMWWGRWMGVGSFGPWPTDPGRMVDKPVFSHRYGLGFATLRKFAP
jgi:hypothetical protein